MFRKKPHCVSLGKRLRHLIVTSHRTVKTPWRTEAGDLPAHAAGSVKMA
jgi:hypothetical protein